LGLKCHHWRMSECAVLGCLSGDRAKVVNGSVPWVDPVARAALAIGSKWSSRGGVALREALRRRAVAKGTWAGIGIGRQPVVGLDWSTDGDGQRSGGSSGPSSRASCVIAVWASLEFMQLLVQRACLTI
jgi:hypothetical protein